MKNFLDKVIQFYQKTFIVLIVPLLKLVFPVECRFFPSCSIYAREAIERHGAKRGVLLAIGRVLRCHPLQVGGIDLVPSKK